MLVFCQSYAISESLIRCPVGAKRTRYCRVGVVEDRRYLARSTPVAGYLPVERLDRSQSGARGPSAPGFTLIVWHPAEISETIFTDFICSDLMGSRDTEATFGRTSIELKHLADA
jgi:hypothetical protein